MAGLPDGLNTFLFTDIAGSTRRWEERQDAMRTALICHDALVREAIESQGGEIFKTVGDAFYAVFVSPPAAVLAALAIQRAIQAFEWSLVGSLEVRVALYAGQAELRDHDYFGAPVNRLARLLAAGHGGQVLLAETVRQQLSGDLPPGVSLRDLGPHRLKDLPQPERVFQLVASDLRAEFPPLNSLERQIDNLPRPATPLIGRAQERAALAALLQNPEIHLVTLTGPGGTGKTRLGLQAAADALVHMADGVCFVPLETVRQPSGVLQAIAERLGLQETTTGILPQLQAHLEHKHMLLLLDNVEQVVAAGPLLAELLAAAPRLKIFSTSRITLQIEGEHIFPVLPLAVPHPDRLPDLTTLGAYDAIALFLQRARARRPDFQLTEANASAIAKICLRLDGLPLVIELAAAQIPILSPHEICQRLTHRLTLLSRGMRNLPPRQQTLRGAIDWSYALLQPEEQRCFARLGVFVGGWGLDAAEAVCGTDRTVTARELLLTLSNHSLLQRHEQAEGVRFSLLETLREYALERLAASGELQQVQSSHAAYYLALLELAKPGLDAGPAQQRWLELLEADHTNLRAALEWLLEQGRLEEALRLAGGLWKFWQLRGQHSEGRRWLTRVLDGVERGAAPAPDPARLQTLQRAQASALWGMGWLSAEQGSFEEARAAFEQSLALARQTDDQRGIGLALQGCGSLARTAGAHAYAQECFEHSLAIFRAIGDPEECAWALDHLAYLARFRGDVEHAVALHRESLAIFVRLEHTWGIANATCHLAEACLDLGRGAEVTALLGPWVQHARDHADVLTMRSIMSFGLVLLGEAAWLSGAAEQAEQLFQESLAISREGLYGTVEEKACQGLGRLALERRASQVAARYFQESLALLQKSWDPMRMAWLLDDLAELAALEQDDASAVWLCGATMQLRAHDNLPCAPVHDARRARVEATLRARLAPAAYAAAWEAGSAASSAAVVARAQELLERLVSITQIC